VNDNVNARMAKLNLEPAIEHVLGRIGYELLGVGFFGPLGFLLWRAARRGSPEVHQEPIGVDPGVRTLQARSTRHPARAITTCVARSERAVSTTA
jgi:hypothetical protein